MADLTAKKLNFITRFREATEQQVALSVKFAMLITEYTAMNYGGVLTDEDFTGENVHMSKAELDAAVNLMGSLLATTGTPENNAVMHAIPR